MKFGFVLPNNIGVEDTNEIIRLGVRAEELGFDSVWVNHHVLHVGYVRERLGTRPYQDALVTMTWLASKTSRVSLGTSVLVMPYLHPMVLAKQLATLDQLSGGRLIVGLGAGSLPEEHPPYDVWCTADDDYLLLRAGAGGYMQTHYELVELERE